MKKYNNKTKNIMLGHIYYFFGLIIFLSNIILTSNIIKLLKLKEWALKFHKVSGRHPMKSDFKENEYEQFTFANLIWIITFFWLFFGIITKSWPIFTVLILFNFLTTFICKKIGPFTLFSKLFEIVRILTNTLTIGFLVMNHFHLHLDIIQFLQN